MGHVVRVSRLAMACRCEAVVVHEDLSFATQAANAALDEIDRVAGLLSRFDPASEISRINRDACREPIILNRELFALLSECIVAWQATGEAFDIAAGCHGSLWSVTLDGTRQSIEFGSDKIQLDLGGCGKGYALDCAAAVLRSLGVTQACLHAGTSSVVAMGAGPDGAGWPIALVEPRDHSRELHRLMLQDESLSTSAVTETADIIDPRTRLPLTQVQSCTVITRSAFIAEVWSTAGVVLGRKRIRSQLQSRAAADKRIYPVKSVYWTVTDESHPLLVYSDQDECS